MGLNKVADQIEATLEKADEAIETRQATMVEHDARNMAHHIVAYVLERAEAGHDPEDLGATMVQGAFMGEDESGVGDGYLADPVIQFLESVLEGAKAALDERFGADALTLDPVQHCVQYMLDHNRWPESATPSVIARAKAALASGRAGGKGKAFGAFL
jgi:hypothetical protein